MIENKNTELHDIYRENGKNLTNDFNMSSSAANPISIESNKQNNFLEKSFKNFKRRVSTASGIHDLTDTFDILNREMQSNDFFTRLIAINLSIEEDKCYDFDVSFSKNMKAFLPWEDTYYHGKSKLQVYSSKNFPDWLKVANISKKYFLSFYSGYYVF